MKNLTIKNEALKTPLYLSQTEYTTSATETIGKIYVIGTQGIAPAGTNAKAGDKVYYDGSKWTVLGKSSGSGSAYSGDVILLQPNLDSMIRNADAWSKYKAVPIFKFDDFDASQVYGVAVITSQNTNDSEGYAIRGANVRVMRPGGDFVEIAAWPESTNTGGGMRLDTDGTIYAYIQGTTGNIEYFLMPIYSKAAELTADNMTVDYSKYSLSADAVNTYGNSDLCLFQNNSNIFNFNSSSNRSVYIKFSSYIGGTAKVGIKLQNKYTSKVTFTIWFTPVGGSTQKSVQVEVATGERVYVGIDVSLPATVPTAVSGSTVVPSPEVVRVVSDSYTSVTANMISIEALDIWAGVIADSSLSDETVHPNYKGIIYAGDTTYSNSSNYRVQSGSVLLDKSLAKSMLIMGNEFKTPTCDRSVAFS